VRRFDLTESGYDPEMKTSKRWVLYEYKGRELVILSKGFKTKESAEKARLKFPDSQRGKIGIGRSL